MATGTIFEDQKKRTLEALERRFAVAKAELLQQQEHLSKKRFRGVDEKVSPCTNSFSVGSSTHPTDSSVTPTLNASLKKGHATSQGTLVDLWTVKKRICIFIIWLNIQ